MKVSNTLGVDFLENVYENALVVELAKAGLGAEQQKPIKVSYGPMTSYSVLLSICVHLRSSVVRL